MIRSFDYIIQYTTDMEGGCKILANIKKRRERTKQKKAIAGESDEEERSVRTRT